MQRILLLLIRLICVQPKETGEPKTIMISEFAYFVHSQAWTPTERLYRSFQELNCDEESEAELVMSPLPSLQSPQPVKCQMPTTSTETEAEPE